MVIATKPLTLLTKPLTFQLCKKLATTRLKEAKILYRKKQYSGAYYLSGYAIELGLKAYYCKGVKKHTFPDREVVNKLYKHDLDDLLDICGLKPEFYKDTKANKSLLKNWGLVKAWTEESRYNQISKSDSESMIKSVEEVFIWMQTKF